MTHCYYCANDRESEVIPPVFQYQGNEVIGQETVARCADWKSCEERMEAKKEKEAVHA